MKSSRTPLVWRSSFWSSWNSAATLGFHPGMMYLSIWCLHGRCSWNSSHAKLPNAETASQWFQHVSNMSCFCIPTWDVYQWPTGLGWQSPALSRNAGIAAYTEPVWWGLLGWAVMSLVCVCSTSTDPLERWFYPQCRCGPDLSRSSMGRTGERNKYAHTHIYI